MKRSEHLRVSSPPPKPLMIWDGDCHFCRRWIERWREITGGEVEYATYQEAADRFPEIPREQFQKSVVYIDKNGEVFFAAEAVYRSLSCRSSRKWVAWSYDHVPGFAPVSELAYKIIAGNRKFGSTITRLLWGGDVRPPTYFFARRWFLRALGVIYLIAFVSLWVQIDGLIGSNGITPASEFLPAAGDQLGTHAWSVLPTLCWLSSSDAFLHFLCGAGVVFSLLLIFGIAPVLSLIALFVFYLSLAIAGQTFLSFQWDILLLEAGFLSIFLAPPQLWPKRGREPPVSRAALFLLKLLLFKLMVMSGVVKLTSGDDCWFNLTALDYHYWSQPLPTIFGWWADQHPEWFKKFSVAFCLVVEIVVPIFIWAPRRPRLVACGLLVFLQIVIGLTGNYCFFNLITIALCLLLIDDAVWRRQRGALQANGGTRAVVSHYFGHRLSMYGAVAAVIVTLPVNALLIFRAFKPEATWPRALAFVYPRLEMFRIVNGYGLFRVMTKDRREIVIEGSANGIDWQPYEFKWKPGDVMRAPGWCAPHQPRLDWQMWFAALGSYRQNPWFVRLVICLLHGKPEVTQLFERNPFPQVPPRYVRARFYRYRFTTTAEHRQTGAWWKRQELGEYLRSVSLEDVR
ncbi:MAG TPA: lipase maturation factor family protein [Chthoniobacterales bacterium]|nr:lipase maturation factor family protein [Chthoniobacterales bacterium]